MDSVPSIICGAVEKEDETAGTNNSARFLDAVQCTFANHICGSSKKDAEENSKVCRVGTGRQGSEVGAGGEGRSVVVTATVPPLGIDIIRKRPMARSPSLEQRAEALARVVGFEIHDDAGSPIKPATTWCTGETEQHDRPTSEDGSWNQAESDEESCDFPQSRRDIESAEKKIRLSMHESFADDGENREDWAGSCCCNQTTFLHWAYISSSSVIGATLRVYLSRLFGEDCERGDDAVQDVFTPLFSQICITAGGRTIQTGGALFRDWPANLLGCFFMGILTSNQHSSPFPWFPKDHPLQRNTFLHTGFGVGLCGCLTTFASWNAQMVVMMDGTHTVLGPQVGSALFGFMLGMTGCVSSFRVGREVSSWMYSRVNKGTGERDVSASNLRNMYASRSTLNAVPPSPRRHTRRQHRKVCGLFRPVWTLHLVALLIIALFIMGDQLSGTLFYKNMLIVTLIAPSGALTRWRMSDWNHAEHPKIHERYFPWLPWGTLLANLIGAFIAIVCQALLDRYSDSWLLDKEWTNAVLFAIKVGFAGSLSTVSTLVKEIVSIQENFPGHAKAFTYGTCTCAGGMIVGLAAYMMIVRIGIGRS